MTGAATTLGAALALVLLGAFPVLVAELPDDPDLAVDLKAPHPYVIRNGATDPFPQVSILPAPAPEGLHLADTAPGSGLDLRSWNVNYSNRWEREVTVPVLTGPFLREGQEVCGLSASIGAGLFDTSGAGAGFQEILSRKIDGALQPTISPGAYPEIRLRVAKPSRTYLKFGFGNGGVGVAVQLVLGDGTWFIARFPLTLGAQDGVPTLTLVRDRLFVSWDGPMKADLYRQAAKLGRELDRHPIAQAVCDIPFVDLVCDAFVRPLTSDYAVGLANEQAPKEVEGKIAEYIEQGIGEVNKGFAGLRGPHVITSNRTASITVRLNGSPIVSTNGIVLHLCAAVQVGAKVNATVPGSVRLGSVSTASVIPSRDASIQLAADGEALNHLLYFLWQSGALRDLGTSKGLVEASLDAARNADGSESPLQQLAFEFKGFDPGLPPTLSRAATTNTLGFALGDIKIGDWGDRRVVAHAAGSLAIDTSGSSVTLAASMKQLTANCTARSSGGAVLTPCVSDLLPTVRESLAATPLKVSIIGDDLLAKLPAMTFGGGQVQLTGLHASTAGSSPNLTIRVGARIVGETGP